MESEERLLELPAGYAAILADLKDQIKSAVKIQIQLREEHGSHWNVS